MRHRFFKTKFFAEGESRPKVIFLTRKWRPAVGGMETYCHEITSELKKLVSMAIVWLPGDRDHSRPSFWAHIVFALKSAEFLLREAPNFDVLHIADLATWPLAIIGRLRNRRILVVLSAHGMDIAFAFRRGFLPRLYRVYLKLGIHILPTPRVIANSRATKQLCRRIGFDNVSVITLGARIHASGDCQPPEAYILFVGRLSTRKGCRWFIEKVLPLLSADMGLKIAATQWDDFEIPDEANPRIDYLGPVFGADLVNLRAQATAVVVPNIWSGPEHYEGFGLTAVEGVSDGGVVIASRVDGLNDAVIDNETGFLLPAGNAPVWANKINEIAGWTIDQRHAFITNALEVIDEQFSWIRTAEKTMKIYDQ